MQHPGRSPDSHEVGNVSLEIKVQMICEYDEQIPGQDRWAPNTAYQKMHAAQATPSGRIALKDLFDC